MDKSELAKEKDQKNSFLLKSRPPLILNFLRDEDSFEYIIKNFLRFWEFEGEKTQFFYEGNSRYTEGFKVLQALSNVVTSYQEEDQDEKVSLKEKETPSLQRYETSLVLSFSNQLKNLKGLNFQYLYNSEMHFLGSLSSLNFMKFYRYQKK